MAKYCPMKRGPALYLECGECEEHECEKFFCLVVGSRSFNDYDRMTRELDHLLANHVNDAVIVSGGAKGADALAKRYAIEKGYPYHEFSADWDKYGKKAGPMRNEEMHKFISNFPKRGAVAFWDGKSKGTASNFELAKKYGNRIVIIRYEN